MAYVALYRAYRPQKFSEVVGQEHIIKTLQNAIKIGKVAHAYLFCGPRGTGKTTFAKILAKAMNCEQGPIIEPCCECEMCKGIAKGVVSDVVELDAASNNGADDMRAICDTVNFMPAMGKYKVYIIDEVHMLSNAAFNVLLKTLEEPPKHVIFILATTEPYKLPATILSRCQRFDFQSISIENIIKRLNVVKEEENINIDDEALYQIAISAEGGMRDALSLLDQAVSYSVNDSITLDDVLSISGNTSYVKIIELLDACIDETETKAIAILDKILNEGKEVPRLINDIILFLRDVLLYLNNTIIEKKMMYENKDFQKLCKRLSKSIVYNWLDILNETLNNTKFSVQKRAFLELAILKMNDTKLNEEATITDRIIALERNYEMLSSNLNTFNRQVPKQEAQIRPNIPTREELERLVNQAKPTAPQVQVEPKSEIEVKPEPVIQNNYESYPMANDDSSYSEAPVEVQAELKPEVEVKPEPVLKPQVAVEERPINVALDDELNIMDIEKIIYNNDSAKREEITRKWEDLSLTHTSFMELQMLARGKVVAVSNKTVIVVLNDVSFCNRVMLYQNYLKIMEVFRENNIDIEDYLCVPIIVFREIMAEYKSLRTPDNPTPKLTDRRIGVKRRRVPEGAQEVKEKSLEDELQDLFPENTLKIVEE